MRGNIVASRFDPKILFGAEIIDSKGTRLAEMAVILRIRRGITATVYNFIDLAM